MRRTTVSVGDEVFDGLVAVARRRGIKLAEVIREALAAYVSRKSAEDRLTDTIPQPWL